MIVFNLPPLQFPGRFFSSFYLSGFLFYIRETPDDYSFKLKTQMKIPDITACTEVYPCSGFTLLVDIFI
ncbi:hypothetical protein TPE_2788 [Treponema pedis str. T A4]|uniref:Uncharacterized protein n=1 Tax=Treponema pedis str. T A4 TaxID=1291379 RepID=S5ZXL3_9SPIR|nr:hypothetical protein TPE_2788 [Treponema pedis str. T A4]